VRKKNPHKGLTATRCVDLLERIEDCSDYKWRYEQLRSAVREHLRYHIVRLERRKR
jgi:hypothetical protein